MGLSASQARLLSITQRLSDNELHSEIIANSKMRLADDGVVAKNKYIDALNSTKLQYVGFDGYGNANPVDLTFNSLMNYSEIKNQNILRNSNGQVLISEQDYENYRTSPTMYDFLAKYGLFDIHDYNVNVNEYEQWQTEYEQYLRLLSKYQVEMAQYNSDMIAYNEYMNSPDVHQMFVDIVGTSSNPQSCYGNALNTTNPSAYCYMHVLMYLLYPIDDGVEGVGGCNGGVLSPTNPETLTTSLRNSSGQYVTVTPDMGNWSGSKLHTETFATTGNQLYPVYQAMLQTKANGTPMYYCDGDDNLNVPGQQNLIQSAITNGRTPTNIEILMSDYVYNYPADPNNPNDYGSVGGVKSLRQKAIDMLLLIKNMSTYGVNNSQMRDLLINFTDGDMSKLAMTPPVRPTAPVMPEQPEYPLGHFDDKAKTQWYINLWHAIDGQEDPTELRAIYDDEGTFKYYSVENKDKVTAYDQYHNPLNPSYEVIRDELRADSDWLRVSLVNGIVTMDQIILDSNENKLVWRGLEYTSTSSFTEVQDDKKIAKAEAEYQSEMKRIENEDAKFDIKIKKLDAEHNALKTEYDSVAQLIGKNVERSYNSFNA